MKHCLVVDDFGRHPQGRAPHPRGPLVPHLARPRTASRRSPPAAPTCRTPFCSTGTCRSWTATSSCRSCAGCRPADAAQGGVLHDRERRRPHRPRDACRRRRVHHEALRQGHHDGQVPGSRARLGAQAERAATFRSQNQAGSMSPAPSPPLGLRPRRTATAFMVVGRLRRRARPHRALAARKRRFEVVAHRAERAARDRGPRPRRSPTSCSSTSTCPSSTASARCRSCSSKRPGLSVIVVSTLTQRNADDLAEMPLARRGRLPAEAGDEPRGHDLGSASASELIAKLQALAGLAPRRDRHRRPSRRRRAAGRGRRAARPCRSTPRCLLIGASTGGPRAVAEVLAGLGGALRQRADRSSCSTCRRSSRRSSPSTCRRQLGVPAREARDGEAPVAGHDLRRARRTPYGPRPRQAAQAVHPARRRAAGEFLPAGRRRPVPRRRRGLRRLRARGGAHRHGLGRHLPARQRSPRPAPP